MRRRALWLAALFLLPGCGRGRRAEPAAPAADPQAVRERAEQSFRELAPELEQARRKNEERRPAVEEASVPKAKLYARDNNRGCSWVESDGLITVGEHDSRHQARAAAVADARQRAMQDFLGVEVRSRFLDFQQEGLRDQQNLTESLLMTTRLGRILDERVKEEGYRDLPGCPGCRYHVRLLTCLTDAPAGADRDFHVEVKVSRARFVQGDEAVLTVSASRDSYVYLYNVGMDWETALIAPNEIVPEIKLKAGETFTYPDEKARARGVRLVAELPPGKKVSAETVRLIATKTPLPASLRQAPDGYLGLLRRLQAARLDWVDDAQAFTIYDR